MKMLFLPIAINILCATCAHYDASLESRIARATEDRNFFHAKELLQNASGKIAPEKLLYYSAITESSFGHDELSGQYIDSLLSGYHGKLTDSMTVQMLSTRAANYVRMYRYGEAAEVFATISERYKACLDSARLTDCMNSRKLFTAIANVPAQRITITHDQQIPAFRNKYGLLMAPVKVGTTASDFIFDTGANLSTISESCAAKMKLHMIETTIDVGSSTTHTVKSRLAVADTLFVGGIMFENVIFLVLPDEKLTFPQVGLVIDGIIGLPVMYQMGEIHIYKSGTIFVPVVPLDRNLRNMQLNFLNPIVAAYTKSDTLLLKLDTGAKDTELFHRYSDKYKDIFDTLKSKTVQRAGAGGAVAEQTYELPDFNFTLGSKHICLPTVSVLPGEYGFTKNLDGNLGQDAIMQFDQMVLNFKYMYIDFY